MDTRGFAHPKPKDRKRTISVHGVRHYRSGREVCDKSHAGRLEYKRRHRLAWERDKGICGICHRPVAWEQSTVDHIEPRGMGGANHDDRVENMQPSHLVCNGEKGSKRNYEVAQ